ncbi:nuclear factor NF-kappa-B p100 subunit isoform X2 [Microplitis demolitor]|nr:nuclear factor NF-kappa-B p100 subunit isoform X2 [Microplitis demolitor]XP_053597046.1 nuclear factor NF-kappa-B p100 subunit isoform X2 [Microplitis demolitor]
MVTVNSPYQSSTASPSVDNMESPLSTVSPLREEDNFTININENFIFDSNMEMELGIPELVILEQPIDKFRFRYKSEMMGTHGSLASANSTTRRKKNAPTVQLRNFSGTAIIRCIIVTKNEDRRIPHAHHLVKREGNSETDRPYEVSVGPENDWTATFHGMGIIHTAKKHIKDELIKKLRAEVLERNRRIDPTITTLNVREETQIKMDAEGAQKWMDLNSVALSFQAFVPNENGVMTPITKPVYSLTINNLKSALTGELKICRIDKYVSSCDGNEEVFLLVEKVGKKNIKVKFFEVDSKGNEIWCAYGRFSELDVHHQYAIVFRTPPYKDREITSPREVLIQLERPTDGDCSEPMKFTYKPSDSILTRKRPRMSYSESFDFGDSILPDTIMSKNVFAMSSDNPTPSDLSAELKKLASEKLPSDDYRDFLENIDLGEYIELAKKDNYDDSIDGDLCTDGKKYMDKLDGPNYAMNVLNEALKQDKDSNDFRKCLKKLLVERTLYGDTPLHSALRHGKREIVKQILKIMSSAPEFNSLIDMQNAADKTPLHYAVMLNQPDIVRTLLSLGANPNTSDNHGSYPLHEAVKRPQSWECVDALLEAKADFNVRDDTGWTPLQLAAENGSLRAIDSLIKAGDDVNSTERSFGRTALHIAVEGGHIEVVKYLLEKTKIDVDKPNLGGNTALHSAVVNTGSRAKELCAILIKHNANPNIPSGHGNIYDTDDNDERETQNRLHESEINLLNKQTRIKQEIEDDDPSHGQTSFDLAYDNEEIRNLLNGTDRDKRSHTSVHNIKEEAEEEEGGGGGGGGEEEEEEEEDNEAEEEETTETSDIEKEKETITEWLDVDQMARLGNILDKNDGWKPLAKNLGCDYLWSSLDTRGASPALAILSYADVQGNLTMPKLLNLLHQMKQTEAATFIEDIINNHNRSHC